jgi:alpha-L-arabinofuranosidase
MDLIDRQALLKKLFPYEVVDKKNYAINAYAVEKAILDMPNKADNVEIQKAKDYLEYVLDNWNTWEEHHKKLCDSIKVLLEVFLID